MCVTEVVLLPQAATPTFVQFDDAGVADHFDRQIDAGRTPEQCGRIWLHTHPGSDPTPSRTDEETFARVFGRCDWAVMAIVARHGATYARLQWHVGPGGSQRLSIELDCTGEFDGTDQNVWAQEYDRCVRPLEMELPRRSRRRGARADLAAADTELPDHESFLFADTDFWNGGSTSP